VEILNQSGDGFVNAGYFRLSLLSSLFVCHIASYEIKRMKFTAGPDAGMIEFAGSQGNRLAFRLVRADPASTEVIGFGDRKTTAKLNNCSQLLTPHFPGRQARRSATNCLLV
jgi:hypothetical protein